jgi:VanW like protein
MAPISNWRVLGDVEHNVNRANGSEFTGRMRRLAAFLTIFMLVACAGATSPTMDPISVVASATPTRPAQTPTANGTPTPSPTRVPTPTATPTAPIPTPTTATPTPTATPTSTPKPTPSPSPSGPPGMTLLGRWTTKFIPGPSNGDGANIRVPAKRIDGTTVKPGQRFDFISAVVPVTNPPYAMGSFLRNGQIVNGGILGGGMCSASTTLFNAAMRAGLRIMERHAHAIYIGRYPVGLDATVWGIGASTGQNVEFINDTGHNVLIKAFSSRRKVTFEIWGVDDGRTVRLSDPRIEGLREAPELLVYTDDLEPGERSRIQDGYDAFESWVTRTVKSAQGKVISKDTWHSSYSMLPGLVQVGRYPKDPPAGTRIPADDYPHRAE